MNLSQLNIQPFIGTITPLRNENLNKCDHASKMSIKSLNRENKGILCEKKIIQTGRKVFNKRGRLIQSWAELTVAHWFWKEYFSKRATYITKYNTLLKSPFELYENVGRDYVD